MSGTKQKKSVQQIESTTTATKSAHFAPWIDLKKRLEDSGRIVTLRMREKKPIGYPIEETIKSLEPENIAIFEISSDSKTGSSSKILYVVTEDRGDASGDVPFRQYSILYALMKELSEKNPRISEFIAKHGAIQVSPTTREKLQSPPPTSDFEGKSKSGSAAEVAEKMADESEKKKSVGVEQHVKRLQTVDVDALLCDDHHQSDGDKELCSMISDGRTFSYFNNTASNLMMTCRTQYMARAKISRGSEIVIDPFVKTDERPKKS